MSGRVWRLFFFHSWVYKMREKISYDLRKQLEIQVNKSLPCGINFVSLIWPGGFPPKQSLNAGGNCGLASQVAPPRLFNKSAVSGDEVIPRVSETFLYPVPTSSREGVDIPSFFSRLARYSKIPNFPVTCP